MSTLILAVITGLVIVISSSLEYFCSLFHILLTKPRRPRGAVEINHEEHVYTHPDYTDRLLDTSSFDAQTIYDALLRGLQLSPNRPHFSYRQSSNESFQSYSHKQVFEILKEIGSGIVSIGLAPCNHTLFGIYASSSMNYGLSLYAAWPYSMVPVCIYDSLGRDGVKFIIRQSAVELIFVDSLQRVQNLLEWKDESSAFKTIVCFYTPSDDVKRRAEGKHLQLLTLETLRQIGRSKPVEFVPPKPTDTAVIMYTSGSTGEPKGEEIGFWQGKVENLVDDFRDFRPTLLAMVPRLLNRLYDKVRSDVGKKGLLGNVLFRLAIRGKLALIRRGSSSQNTLWDRLIFGKIRQSLGGRVTRVISTGAPLSVDVCEFSRAAFSCPFIECYGQTECVIIFSQTVGDTECGDTGIPTPATRVKLVDVPEKEYYAKDGVGEVCLQSSTLFKGYFNDTDKTREAVDDDGWLHTGDIGRWTPYNTLKLVDRKKNMYKLNQGEYVAPEKIEDIYGRSRFITQIFVYGNSYESFLVAIVVLNEEYVHQWKRTESVESSESLNRLKQAVLDDMTQEGKRCGLMSYEQVKAIEFIHEPFTIEGGLLTPTFKARRYAIEKKYKQLLEGIYKTVKLRNSS